jgi:hypothetical protein
VLAGEPQDKDKYDEHLLDGIKVYILRSMPAQNVKILYRHGLFGGLSIKTS